MSNMYLYITLICISLSLSLIGYIYKQYYVIRKVTEYTTIEMKKKKQDEWLSMKFMQFSKYVFIIASIGYVFSFIHINIFYVFLFPIFLLLFVLGIQLSSGIQLSFPIENENEQQYPF